MKTLDSRLHGNDEKTPNNTFSTACVDLTLGGFLSGRTTLLELFFLLRDGLAVRHPSVKDCQPVHRDFRAGDVMHSQADIEKARALLGYAPSHTIESGLEEALGWYEKNVGIK